MDVTSANALPSYAPATASDQASTDVQIATLKKSLDIQAETATQLVQSIPDASAGLPDGVGQNINVTA